MATASGGLAAVAARVLQPAAWARILFVTDLMMVTLGSAVAASTAPGGATGLHLLLAALFSTVAVTMMHSGRGPDQRLHTSILDVSTQTVRAASWAAVLTMAAASVVGASHPVQVTLRLWLFAAAYLILARALLAFLRAQAIRNQALATPTLIVGAGVIGEHVVKRLTDEPGYGLRLVGLLDSEPMSAKGREPGVSVPILGGWDNLTEAIRQTGARRVIVAFSSEPDHLLVDKLRECEQLGVEVSLVPRLFDVVNDRAISDHLGGLPLISLRPINPRGWAFAIKHALDRTVALVALIVLSPLIALSALAVRLTSPGPALFRQQRVGRDGRVFEVLKFRTMRVPDRACEAEFEPPTGCAPGGIEGEDRTTAIGRWLRGACLDELPQLINVLRGEMSIVGPRPERQQFAARFAAEVDRYEDRLRVKPGITGWAQVNGLRGQTSIADRVEWDNYYIRNWSLTLDFKIMLLTISEIARLRDSWHARRYKNEPSRLNVGGRQVSVALDHLNERRAASYPSPTIAVADVHAPPSAETGAVMTLSQEVRRG